MTNFVRINLNKHPMYGMIGTTTDETTEDGFKQVRLLNSSISGYFRPQDLQAIEVGTKVIVEHTISNFFQDAMMIAGGWTPLTRILDIKETVPRAANQPTEQMPAGQDDGRFSTCYMSNHTAEFDRADGTLRLSWPGDQTFLSNEETRDLLDMLDNLRDEVMGNGTILAAITPTMDPDKDVFIRVLLPGATGVKVLPSRDVQDYDQALALIKAAYPAARIVAPHVLDEEVMRRQPPAQPGLVVEDDLMDIEF